jgi:hypothetical protein
VLARQFQATTSRFFAQLADRAERELRGADQIAWLDRLDRDIQNIRQALSWCIARGESDLALRISGRIGWFWNTRGRPREGFEWATRALALPGDPWSAERANTASRAARCAWFLDDHQAHDRLLREALEIWDHNQDQLGTVRGLNYRIGQLWRDGNTREATNLQRASMDLFRAAGHWGLVSDGLAGLALASREEGDDAAATAYLQEALETVEQSHDISTYAFVSIHLAGQMHYNGDVQASIRHAGEGERVAWLLGDKDLAANAIYERAIANLEAVNLTSALALFQESEELFVECDTPRDATLSALYAAGIRVTMGDPGTGAIAFTRAFAELRARGWAEDRFLCAEAGSGLAMALGRNAEVLRLIGYATRQRAQAGLRRTPFESSRVASLEAMASRSLGDAVARQVTTDGEGLSEEEVFNLLDNLAEAARQAAAPGTT